MSPSLSLSSFPPRRYLRRLLPDLGLTLSNRKIADLRKRSPGSEKKMSSTSDSKMPAGGDSASGVGKTLSQRMTRAPTMINGNKEEQEPTANSELVPSSLASIVPKLRVANEIEEMNPRVAYLCASSPYQEKCIRNTYSAVQSSGYV